MRSFLRYNLCRGLCSNARVSDAPVDPVQAQQAEFLSIVQAEFLSIASSIEVPLATSATPFFVRRRDVQRVRLYDRNLTNEDGEVTRNLSNLSDGACRLLGLVHAPKASELEGEVAAGEELGSVSNSTYVVRETPSPA